MIGGLVVREVVRLWNREHPSLDKRNRYIYTFPPWPQLAVKKRPTDYIATQGAALSSIYLLLSFDQSHISNNPHQYLPFDNLDIRALKYICFFCSLSRLIYSVYLESYRKRTSPELMTIHVDQPLSSSNTPILFTPTSSSYTV